MQFFPSVVIALPSLSSQIASGGVGAGRATAATRATTRNAATTRIVDPAPHHLPRKRNPKKLRAARARGTSRDDVAPERGYVRADVNI